MKEQIPTVNLDRSWTRFSEQPVVKKLEGMGIKNIESAFQIASENDLNGNRIEDEAEIFWLKFKPPSDFSSILSAEGKLYVPKQVGNKTLIHYAPSFPQGNAGRFEKRYVDAFLKAGYSFFAGRHNGASLTKGETLNEIMNAPKRIEIAKACDEQHIGGREGKGYLPSEIHDEPITSLSALAPAFDKINLVAQSFGASSHYNAVNQFGYKNPARNREILKKIHNIISISGYLGKDKEDLTNHIWDGTKIPALQFGKYQIDQIQKSDFNFKTSNIGGDLPAFISDMRIVAGRNSTTQLPHHIGNILFFTPDDPFIAGPKDTTLEALKYYGPAASRKLIISDQRMQEDDKRPHSMDWITSNNLIAAMETIVSKGDPQYHELQHGDPFLA